MGTPKLTTEDWLQRAYRVHGNSYSYQAVVYTGADDPVLISCKAHGDFVQSASAHLSGKGCPDCGRIRMALAKTQKARDAFILKASKLHTGKYCYVISTYKDSKTKMQMSCSEHGTFWQSPSDHLKGRGCRGCAWTAVGDKLRKSSEQYIEDCINVHGDTYDYSVTEYKATHHKVDIVCRVHGVFTTQSMGHLAGKGCPSCAKAGYKTTEPGYLYVLTCNDITKIGITNKSPESRCKQVNTDSDKRFSVLKSYHFKDGKVANDLETLLLREMKMFHSQPVVPFKGSTECFYHVNLANLLNRIDLLIKEHHSSNNQASQEA